MQKQDLLTNTIEKHMQKQEELLIQLIGSVNNLPRQL